MIALEASRWGKERERGREEKGGGEEEGGEEASCIIQYNGFSKVQFSSQAADLLATHLHSSKNKMCVHIHINMQHSIQLTPSLLFII